MDLEKEIAEARKQLANQKTSYKDKPVNEELKKPSCYKKYIKER